MGAPVLCKVLSGVRCAAANMLVELELVSMTVGSQHANLLAVVGVMLGPCSMVACQWLGWCLTGYTQFVTLTPFGWLAAEVEHPICSFLQDKELTCAFCAKQWPRLEGRSVTASQQRIAQSLLRHLAVPARTQQRAASVAIVSALLNGRLRSRRKKPTETAAPVQCTVSVEAVKTVQ